jgi:hypothetical protein
VPFLKRRCADCRKGEPAGRGRPVFGCDLGEVSTRQGSSGCVEAGGLPRRGQHKSPGASFARAGWLSGCQQVTTAARTRGGPGLSREGECATSSGRVSGWERVVVGDPSPSYTIAGGEFTPAARSALVSSLALPPGRRLSGHCRGWRGYQPSVTSNVAPRSAVESPPTQISKVAASCTQSRSAAFQ